MPGSGANSDGWALSLEIIVEVHDYRTRVLVAELRALGTGSTGYRAGYYTAVSPYVMGFVHEIRLVV